MTLPQDFIGVDVSKDWIDVHHLATGRAERIPATAEALVVFEASGGYDRPLAEALAAAGVGYARVNPRQAREFARATGKLAKTDSVDAQVLARMGQALQLSPTQPIEKETERLAELVARRDHLVAVIGSERNRAAQARDGWIGRQIASLLTVLGDHLAAVEAEIAAPVAASGALAAAGRKIASLLKVLGNHLAAVEAEIAAPVAASGTLAAAGARLRSMPGIGPAVSAVLLARLPEPGRLDHRRIASLAGLAPHACDSGTRRGKRQVWGGRADVRRALTLAGFIASRHDPTLRAFRQRLQAAGKPTKVAIVAGARKLLTSLNAMARDATDYRPTAT